MLVVVAAVSGCATTENAGPTPRTQVELRHFQTRTYPTDDARLVMKAMINVLQDVGFIVKNADAGLGVITAEKWSDVQHTRKAIKRAKKKGAPLPASAVVECTANVSEFGKECRVRLSFQRKLMSASGAVMQARVVDDAAFYQQFFAKIDKGIFLQQQGI